MLRYRINSLGKVIRHIMPAKKPVRINSLVYSKLHDSLNTIENPKFNRRNCSLAQMLNMEVSSRCLWLLCVMRTRPNTNTSLGFFTVGRGNTTVHFVFRNRKDRCAARALKTSCLKACQLLYYWWSLKSPLAVYFRWAWYVSSKKI